VETAKRLIVGGFLLLVFVLFAPAAARANGVSTWTDSWCGPSSTWSGLAGLNNDYPGPATITGLTVSNGVTLSNMTVGKVIGTFENGNIEGTATGLPMTLASFTVTITLAVPGGGSVTRTMTVTRPADCGGVVDTTAATTIPATTSPATTAPTTAVPPGATTVTNPTTTPTAPSQPTASTTAPATTVPLKPSVLGSTVTPPAAGGNTILPKTGGQSTRAMSTLAAISVALGVALVAITRIARPVKP
jgi:LPXTG-motif cell wall-anchored protein